MLRKNKRASETILVMFAKVIAAVCMISLLAMVVFTAMVPKADITPFLHVFLVSFGYLVGNIPLFLKMKE